MKILFTGGGTLGSVMPLVAIHQKFICRDAALPRLKEEYQSLWIGTKKGPEKDVVEKQGIEFKFISAGKLRRYFDLRNIIDLFKIKFGFWQAFFIILKFKPHVVLTAGAFVSVPVVWAAWILRVPIIIHQQDVKAGLANKLMAPFATKITVALDKSLKDYNKKKTVLVGNQVRKELVIRNKEVGGKEILNKFGLKGNLPVLLVVGGGTGALALNKIVINALDELTKFCQIIHVTGKGKCQSVKVSGVKNNYVQVEFLGEEIFDALEAADVVISRAGMSFLTELAFLKKPTIIVPIPNSHQEKNAEYLVEKEACVYLKQKELDKVKFVKQVKPLIDDERLQKELGEKINKLFVDYSGEKIIKVIKQVVDSGR